MATGLAPAEANAILNAHVGTFWIKLHVGDPGAAGTSNAAGNTVRKLVTFGTPASGGAISNTAIVTWTNVSTTEDYTHWSSWDAVAAGNFKSSGTLTASAVGAGDNFDLPVGDIDLSLNVAS